MRQARKPLVGAMVAALVAAVAFTVPAGAAGSGANASGGPVAVDAKKCKKKKKRKCRKGGGSGTTPYLQGRYSGDYAEIPADLLFNVVGSRLYTGAFDAFHVVATCHNSSGVGSPTYEDVVRIQPVQAFIGPGGNFSGAGTYPTGSGRFIPWKISGNISGENITSGFMTVGPYPDFAGDPCSGSTNFTAHWIGSYIVG
jgi:hypothetical protein